MLRPPPHQSAAQGHKTHPTATPESSSLPPPTTRIDIHRSLPQFLSPPPSRVEFCLFLPQLLSLSPTTKLHYHRSGREWLTFARENQFLVGDHVVFRVLPSTMELVLVGVYRHNPATPHCASSGVRPHEATSRDQDLSEGKDIYVALQLCINDALQMETEVGGAQVQSEVVQKLNDEIKLRNEEFEAKDETIRKLRNEKLLAEQRISGLEQRISELEQRMSA
ncbi:hypothetical protein ACE6H2_018387 [Prunus campanulata]